MVIVTDAQAARWFGTRSISGQVTATSNAAFQASGSEQADVIVEVTPRVGFRAEGGRFSAGGSLAVTASHYLARSATDRLAPTADVFARLEAIENFFFIDGSLRILQTFEDPFGPQPIGTSSINNQTQYEVRITPAIRGRIGTRTQYEVQSDNTYVDRSGGSGGRPSAWASRNSAQLNYTPAPLGGGVSYERNDAAFESGGSARRTTELARAYVNYAVTPALSIGVRAGQDRTNFPGFDQTYDVYGGQISWRPSERTDLSVVAEKRFFGNGWQASFVHRRPRMAWTLRSSRDVSTQPQLFLNVPTTFDVAALINASLATRIPDPVQRARFVEDLIVSRGLPRSLQGAVNIYGDAASLRQDNSVALTLFGVRSSIIFSVFHAKSEQLILGSTGGVIPAQLQDNKQFGLGAGFSRELDQRTSLNAEASWRDTSGLAAFDDQSSRQQTYQVRLTRRLGPRTTGTAGARFQHLSSNVTNDSREVAAFAGLTHEF